MLPAQGVLQPGIVAKNSKFFYFFTGLISTSAPKVDVVRSQEVMQGRLIGPDEVKMISDVLARNPDWNRPQLSREVCRRWDGRNGKGQIKDRAARWLLLKLQARGLITLPKRAQPGRPNHRGLAAVREMAHQTEAIQEHLEELKPVVCSLSADFQRRLRR